MQYLNISMRMGIIEGFLNWFIQRIATIVGLVLAGYVGKLFRVGM